jgi:hypothetical protein
MNIASVAVVGNLCERGACNWIEADGAGTCLTTTGKLIGCYPSAVNETKDGTGKVVHIDSPGRAEVVDGVYRADTANAICTPAGPIPAINRQVGLPGLTFQKRNFQIIPKFPEGQK